MRKSPGDSLSDSLATSLSLDMDYFTITRKAICSLAFNLASRAQQGVWIHLVSYCADVENGGRISACKGWDEVTWVHLCGVRPSEVKLNSTLWKWDKRDLVVEFYPAHNQELVNRYRKGARLTNAKRWATHRRVASDSPANHSALAQRSPPESLGKVRLGKVSILNAHAREKNSAARGNLEESKVRFAALRERIKALECKGVDDELSPTEDAELTHMKADLEELQRKQAKGEL